MTDLPSNLSFCTFVGRFGASVIAAFDADGYPDLVPLTSAELTVTFTASVKSIIDAAASPAVQIAMKPTVCTLDSAGYIVDADGNRNIRLIATDDPDTGVTGWTYNVTFSGTESGRFRNFSTQAPAGSTIDLATVTPVPSSSGVSLDAASAQAAAAAASATSAASSAASAAASAASVDPAAGRLLAAANPDSIIYGAVTRDSNGAVTAADVIWQDGTVGTYVGTASTVVTGAIDSYVITYGSPTVTHTYTQPTMTRNASGAVTVRPTIVVT